MPPSMMFCASYELNSILLTILYIIAVYTILPSPFGIYYSMSHSFTSSVLPPHEPIRTIIVDDSPGIRANVQIYLKRHFPERISVVGEGADVDDSVALIRRVRPQLLLLDIELMTGTCFDILDIVTEEEREHFSVVLITQFDHYVKQALRYGVVDYIDKPILADSFKRGIERGIKKVLDREEHTRRLKEQIKEQMKEQMRAELAAADGAAAAPIIKEEPLRAATLQVRHAGGSEQVQEVVIASITHCLASGSYTFIYRQTGQPIMDSKPLKRYEERLLEHGFLRISRSLVVNPQHCKIVRDGRTDVTVILPDGTSHYVEGAYKEKILAFIQARTR